MVRGRSPRACQVGLGGQHGTQERRIILRGHLGDSQQRLGSLELPCQDQRPAKSEAQARIGLNHFAGETLVPAEQGGDLAAPEQVAGCLLDQTAGIHPVICCQAMPDGVLQKAMRLIPPAGGLVQPVHLSFALEAQPVAQQFLEEMVITIPLPAGVQRGDKKVSPLEALQQGGAVAAPGNQVTQPASHSLEQGSLQQKFLGGGWLALKNFLEQVIQDKTAAAREGGNKLLPVWVTLD